MFESKKAIKTRQRGFNLAELAIVLGVVGIILSGVWAISGSVSESARRETMFQEVVQTVKGVRTYYEGQYNVNISMSSSALTDLLIRHGAIPSEMVPDRTVAVVQANTPWTKTVTAEGSFLVRPDTGNAFHFQIEMRNIPYGACITLATRLSGDGAPKGLTGLSIDGTTMSTIPVTVGSAQASCNKQTSGSKLVLTYLLRQQ